MKRLVTQTVAKHLLEHSNAYGHVCVCDAPKLMCFARAQPDFTALLHVD